MKTIHITNFVRRQTPDSEFSHWTISDKELIKRTQNALLNAKQGYREGVLVVPIEADGFFTGVTQLKEGDRLIGVYKTRTKGETPRKSVFVENGEKQKALKVDIILYSHDVLKENDENETNADYEIISVNARTTEADQPIEPFTLLANHFQDDGGTATNKSPEEFEKALKESYLYWRDKALIRPKEK